MNDAQTHFLLPLKLCFIFSRTLIENDSCKYDATLDNLLPERRNAQQDQTIVQYTNNQRSNNRSPYGTPTATE